MSRHCECDGRYHSRFVHFWQRWTARSLSVEVTYFHGDDVTESKAEASLEVPAWVWRPRCWIKNHENDGYGACVFCRAAIAPAPGSGSLR